MTEISDVDTFMNTSASEAAEKIRLLNRADREILVAAIQSRLVRAEEAADKAEVEQAMYQAGEMELRLAVLKVAVPLWDACATTPFSEVVDTLVEFVVTGVLRESVGALQ